MPLFPVPTTLDPIRPLKLRTVVRAPRQGKLWNEFVARCHGPGCKPPSSARRCAGSSTTRTAGPSPGVYRASGRIRVATTQRRGRYDTHRQCGKPKNDI